MGAVLAAIVVLVLVGWGVSVHYRRRRERKALLSVLAQIRVLRQLVEQVQRHRGLSYGVMSGERSLEARRWSVHQQVNQLFETCQLYQPSLHWHGSWHDALACWTQLKEGREEQDPESMLLIHNEMIRNLLATVQGLAERHLHQYPLMKSIDLTLQDRYAIITICLVQGSVPVPVLLINAIKRHMN